MRNRSFFSMLCTAAVVIHSNNLPAYPSEKIITVIVDNKEFDIAWRIRQKRKLGVVVSTQMQPKEMMFDMRELKLEIQGLELISAPKGPPTQTVTTHGFNISAHTIFEYKLPSSRVHRSFQAKLFFKGKASESFKINVP